MTAAELLEAGGQRRSDGLYVLEGKLWIDLSEAARSNDRPDTAASRRELADAARDVCAGAGVPLGFLDRPA